MKLFEHYSLKALNTFGVDVYARYFVELNEISNLTEIKKLQAELNLPLFILGGGSNILFTKNVDAIVIKISSKGRKILNETYNFIDVEFQSGEHWDEVVNYCVQNGWGGVENMSLIPGTIGAAPIQNIGAYGQELKDVFVSLEGMFLDFLTVKKFTLDECKFGYRTSIFKEELKDKFLITSVCLRLNKNPIPNIAYGSIKELINKNINEITIIDVRKAVSEIRNEKLPDPSVFGNAGSFFRNPVISVARFNEIESIHQDIVSYQAQDDYVKIPAGWLIEKAGLKGKRIGNVGIHKNQALVIVNYGLATGQEISEFKDYVKDCVYKKFNIQLEEEVNIV